MERIKVTVKEEINWAGNRYLIYSTEEHGKIAELDYPHDGRNARVYALNISDSDYVSFSSVPSAMVGAETAVKGYLLDRGIYVVEFKYPRTIRIR